MDLSQLLHLIEEMPVYRQLAEELKQQNGQLRLASIRPQIMEVFVITKLNRLFRISATRAEALGSFE